MANGDAPFGTCAEYITLPSPQAVRLPANASFEVGACLGIPAMTAFHAVAVSGAAPGMTLLIAGGAGAVGHYAVQFAKAAGATVISTVSSPQKADAACAAGADHVIDYKRDNVGERVMANTGNKGVDAIIELDIAANAKLIPHVLRPRGTVVVYGTGATESPIPLFFLLRNAITLKFVYVYELDAAERAAALAGIKRALAAGTLLTNIGATFPARRHCRCPRSGRTGRSLRQRRRKDRVAVLCGVFHRRLRVRIFQRGHDLLLGQPGAVIAFDQQRDAAAVVDVPRPAHGFVERAELFE